MSAEVLLELHYLPGIPYVSALAAHSVVVLEQSEHYVKGSFRNRCLVATAAGPQRLSIPLQKGKNQAQPVRDVRLAYDEPWQRQHWRTLSAAYGRAPFYAHYADLLAPFFLQKKYVFLWDWNLDLLRCLLPLLPVRADLRLSEGYHPVVPTGLSDFRNRLKPGAVPWEGYAPPAYPQVFEDRLGFLPGLSILDLLFCMGPAAASFLPVFSTPQEQA
ncbi:MAG: hypothetical protein RLY31_2843 [Bacteroidota bacterium]|jgi:hypothetical protein